ncbi:hypothetical protein V498_01831 [Pseudogymnoascus sp. VKM F-4517 (FW-2822)]|nr:hypothetical protein V498_01831 [Pseudogymnoascus sp. VKM F-4517 (FW-2822)]
MKIPSVPYLAERRWAITASELLAGPGFSSRKRLVRSTNVPEVYMLAMKQFLHLYKFTDKVILQEELSTTSISNSKNASLSRGSSLDNVSFNMGNTTNIFQGLSAFPITPTDSDGKVNTGALGRIIERLDMPGVDSIGLLGSTGTYIYLTRHERKRAIDVAIQTLRGRKPLIVSAGALRTDDAQHLAKDAEEAGVDGLLLAPVSYFPLTEEEVYQHYESVAGSTTLPICIYNTPSTTHFTFSDALLARIAGLPNVVALKQPAPTNEPKGRHEALRAKLPSGFSVGYSADWLVADSLLAGGSAWYSVIAGVLPAPSVALMDGIRRGDDVEVKRISALFQPIWDLFQEFGDLRVVYALANELDLCKAAPPRPILPIAALHHNRIVLALAKVNEGMNGRST